MVGWAAPTGKEREGLGRGSAGMEMDKGDGVAKEREINKSHFSVLILYRCYRYESNI